MSVRFTNMLVNICQTRIRKINHLKFPSHISWCQIKWYSTNDDDKKKLIRTHAFQNIESKNKESYLEMLNIYKEKDIMRRGQVEFIYSALKYMKEFGVEKDLEIYKSLVDIFPKGKMIPTTVMQAEFMHYPKHQQCAIDILEQMEDNGVMPDWDMEQQLLNVFGKRGYPLRKYWRMMYWIPKFKNASPWPLPRTVPSDGFELAMLAVERMCSVDITSEITIFKTSDVKDSIDDTWIISGQSPDQIELLKELPDKTPLYVEGRFRIWMRNSAVTYFILRADIRRKVEIEDDMDDVSNLKIPFFSKPSALPEKSRTVHEQDDGIILALCCTGTSSRDSLLSWIRLLERSNPRLGQLPIVFTLKAPPDHSLTTTDDNSGEDNTQDQTIKHE